MTIAEIRKQFRNEWVLIEYKKLDEGLAVVEGDVIAHSPDKTEVYRHLLNMGGGEVAIEFAGDPPQDLAVMFLHG